MICPIMSKLNISSDGGKELLDVQCQKEACAWFAKLRECCVAMSIETSLRDISDNTDKLRK